MQIFPAILIGGPPHSGKSVLTYSLSQALRQQAVPHYALRACPDGEGDWANELDQTRVRLIRAKGAWTPAWVERISRDIVRRHLPLLVDVGGKPEPWQEPIFSHCTHAVLLAPDEAGLAEWRGYARRHGLTIIAELTSEQAGVPAIEARTPLFRARLTGLQRGTSQVGPAFAALVEQLRPHFNYNRRELAQVHLNTAPVELALDLDELARTRLSKSGAAPALWQPRHLLELLDRLPQGTPLALYGRAPNWLVAAVALQTDPAPFYQFDARLGWIAPPPLQQGTPPTGSPLNFTWQERADAVELTISIPGGYLDYAEAAGLIIPHPPAQRPLLLNGRLPHWLTTALAIAYRDARLLSIHQPQAGNVVIHSKSTPYLPGDLWPPG